MRPMAGNAAARARALAEMTPMVDVDLGIGRQFGYLDPLRRRPDDLPSCVGVLSQARTRAGLSEAQLARVLGVRERQVQRWERGVDLIPVPVRARWLALTQGALWARHRHP